MIRRLSFVVSLVSWSAYLVAALLPLWHGIRQRDRNITSFWASLFAGELFSRANLEFQRGFASVKRIMWTIAEVHMKCFVGGAVH